MDARCASELATGCRRPHTGNDGVTTVEGAPNVSGTPSSDSARAHSTQPRRMVYAHVGMQGIEGRSHICFWLLARVCLAIIRAARRQPAPPRQPASPRRKARRRHRVLRPREWVDTNERPPPGELPNLADRVAPLRTLASPQGPRLAIARDEAHAARHVLRRCLAVSTANVLLPPTCCYRQTHRRLAPTRRHRHTYRCLVATPSAHASARVWVHNPVDGRSMQ